MPKFFKRKKTGEIISEATYKERMLENVEANTLDISRTEMDLTTDVVGNFGDYDPYDVEHEK